MANVIARCGRPALILEPNKTLAAQVCSEMREFFPDSAVEYFVSYYDYYQPEAYIPGKDMYIAAIQRRQQLNDMLAQQQQQLAAQQQQMSPEQLQQSNQNVQNAQQMLQVA